MTDFDINEIKRKNLRRIMEMRGLTPTTLADKASLHQSQISACLNGGRNMGGITIKKLCDALGVDKEEFFKIETIGLTPPVRLPRPIPVISWVQAGLFVEAIDLYSAGVSGEREPVHSTKAVGLHAFALRVEGDSMAPRYLPGDIIVVDPGIMCDNNAPCVVVLNGEATFKLFKESDDAVILHPMNNKYPEIVIRKDSQVDFRVVGKVVDLIPKM